MSFETFVVDLEEELHVGDLTKFVVAVVEKNPADPDGPKIPVPLVGITTKNLKFQLPGDGVGLTEDMDVDDEAGGLLSFTAVVGTLSRQGDWKAQPEIAITGWSGHAQQFAFKVFPNLTGAP